MGTWRDRRVAGVPLLAALVVGALLAGGCGSSDGAADWSLDDPAGDVAAGAGPDLVAVTVERDDTTITFRVEFADAPPLAVSEEEGWIDMILVGVDVPPPGPAPVAPGGEWPGVDFAFGTHGPSETAMLVQLGAAGGGAAPEREADIDLETDGATLVFRVPRDELGDPETMAVSVAAAREWNEPAQEPAGIAPDVAPDAGTWSVDFDE